MYLNIFQHCLKSSLFTFCFLFCRYDFFPVPISRQMVFSPNTCWVTSCQWPFAEGVDSNFVWTPIFHKVLLPFFAIITITAPPWLWCAYGIPTERIPIGIRSVVKYSGHHHHHHYHHHCHHCSLPLSLFMNWFWPNQLVLLIYTNWREPSAHAECADHKSEFSEMVKVDQIQPGAKKNYNCNQCGYSVPNFPIWKLTCELIAERNPLFIHSATTSCNQAGRLRIHMRIHSGEKPYNWAIIFHH